MRTIFTHFIRKRAFGTLFLLLAGIVGIAQNVPEYMYFKFDASGNQTNYASSPVGNNPATLDGLTVGSTGQFGTALIGNGLTSTSNRLNTGWATNLPSSGWTISFWLNNFAATSSTTFYYFGDVSASSFRCFTGGVAGNGNLLVRGGGLTDTPINGIPTTPTVIHIVYTGSALKIYMNGVYTSQVAQPSVTITGSSGPFTVGGYSSSNSINAGTLMDEWRMYNRALTDTEISQTWNQSLPLITSGPPIVTTTAATGVTSSGATLNGTVDANGESTTVTFEYGLTTSYGSSVPGTPGTVTGSTVTPVSASLTGLLPGTTYHYRVVGVNTNGTTNGNDMTFTTDAAAPTVATTAATNVTASTATLNGTVIAGNASTTVTFEYGLTTAYGTTVPGVPGTVTGNTLTPVSADITGLTVNTTYHFRVKGVNSVGTSNGNDMTFYASNCPLPAPPGTITGTSSGCGNTTGNVYSVAPVTFATGYTWSVPPGSVITSGNNTNSITVTFGNTSGTVSVYGTNTCGNGPTSTLAVTINQAPVPTITGQNMMCVNSGYFDYTTEAGMTNYVWTVSAGGTITWGQGTNQAQVIWTVGGPQTISVNYTSANGCPAAMPTVFSVNVTTLPGNAGTITGTATTCAGASGVAYSVAPITGAMTYVWTLPAGAMIASGAGTNSILVDFGTTAMSGNITVYGNSLCGNGGVSPNFAVTVNPLPGDPGTITGEMEVCQGDAGVMYTVSPITNATGYTWAVPSGATIVAGNNTNSITVDFSISATSGDVTVMGSNTCGNGMMSTLAVTVNPIPPAPVITISGNDLMSDAPMGNQWYMDGTMIPGATGQTYTPTQSGEYWCVVTLNGCSSAESNHIMWVMTGISQSQAPGFTLYPVPNDGQFTVTVTSPVAGSYSLEVYNTIGTKIFSQKIEVDGTAKEMIDLRPLPGGVYTIVLLNSDSRVMKRFVVNR